MKYTLAIALGGLCGIAVAEIVAYHKFKTKVETPIKPIDHIKNQLVVASKTKQVVPECQKLVEMINEYGTPLATFCSFTRIQDAIDTRPYMSTNRGPIFNTDPNAPKIEFVDPVPVNKFRNKWYDNEPVYMSTLLRDLGSDLLYYEKGK